MFWGEIVRVENARGGMSGGKLSMDFGGISTEKFPGEFLVGICSGPG